HHRAKEESRGHNWFCRCIVPALVSNAVHQSASKETIGKNREPPPPDPVPPHPVGADQRKGSKRSDSPGRDFQAPNGRGRIGTRSSLRKTGEEKQVSAQPDQEQRD